jgi:hypothetical protein
MGNSAKAQKGERLFREATENNPSVWSGLCKSGHDTGQRVPVPGGQSALSRAVHLEPTNTGALSAYGMVLFAQRSIKDSADERHISYTIPARLHSRREIT